jgi:hypothetical protein
MRRNVCDATLMNSPPADSLQINFSGSIEDNQKLLVVPSAM